MVGKLEEEKTRDKGTFWSVITIVCVRGDNNQFSWRWRGEDKLRKHQAIWLIGLKIKKIERIKEKGNYGLHLGYWACVSVNDGTISFALEVQLETHLGQFKIEVSGKQDIILDLSGKILIQRHRGR